MTVKQFFKIIKPKLFNDNFPYTIKVEYKNDIFRIEKYDGEYSKNFVSVFIEKNRDKSNFFKLETFNDLEILNIRELIEGTFESL